MQPETADFAKLHSLEKSPLHSCRTVAEGAPARAARGGNRQGSTGGSRSPLKAGQGGSMPPRTHRRAPPASAAARRRFSTRRDRASRGSRNGTNQQLASCCHSDGPVSIDAKRRCRRSCSRPTVAQGDPEFGELGKMDRIDSSKAIVDAAVRVSQSQAGIIAGLVKHDRTQKQRVDLVELSCLLDTWRRGR